MSQVPESWNRLLDQKGLALALNRARSFVAAMKRRGFPMPGGRATVFQAVQWLIDNPNPRGRRVPPRHKMEQRRPSA